MTLLDRVATLVRANLNELIDRAENPETMLKQVILDMENQFMQVKTQVAMALADLHLLEKKQRENADKHTDWMRKAELAVEKHDDALARAALERAISFQQLAENFAHQIANQEAQVDSLKSALKKLEVKLSEARARADVLIVQLRRARTAGRTADARDQSDGGEHTFDRMQSKVHREEAISAASSEMLADDLNARLHSLEREQQVDALLAELKARKGTASSSQR